LTPKKPFSKAAFAYHFRIRGRAHSVGVLENSFSIINHKAYQYYNNNSKLANRKDVANYVEHGKLISMFYKIAAEKLIEARGGLFLEGLGYFGIIQEMSNRPSHNKADGSILLNPKTDNKIYNLAYVPIDKTNILKPWVLDYSFCTSVKKALSKSLKSGKKYSFNASLFFHRLKKAGNNI